MRLWQGLRPFAEEKTPFGFLENHLRSARPFQTTIPAITVSGGLAKIAWHIFQAPNLRRWARIVIDQLYLYSIFYSILPDPTGNDLPRFLGYKHLQPLRTFPNVPTISASFTKGLKTSLHSIMLTVSLIHMFLYLLDVVLLETYVRN